MTVPPAHRRLVPRGPKGPRGPTEPDDFEETTEHPKLDRAAVAAAASEDDASPDPASSLEMTARRPMLEPEDALDVELTLETRALDQSADDSFHQMTVERVRPISQPGDDVLETARAASPDDEEPPPLDKVPSAPRFSESVMRGLGDGDFLNEPTGFERDSESEIEDRAMAHVSPAERGLLAAMSEGHEPSRLVYADWLARRGEVARAEFLRLDHALVAMSPLDERFLWSLHRLRELAPQISVDWRSRVARSAIEGCLARGVACPGEWRRLPTDHDDVRTCGACGEAVYYCATIQLAQELIQQGQRVAIDITCNRWSGDLGKQCASCRGHIPPDTRFCPHCGRPVPV
jgi:uncharacterized protein (TIGR02996 family)